MKRLFLVLCALLAPALVQASPGVCGDANGLTEIFPATDPSIILAAGPNCFVISDTDAPAQQDFYQNNGNIRTNGKVDHRKIKIVGGLMVEKDQAARNAIDTADAAVAAETAAKATEITANTFCSAATLTVIKSRIATAQATGVTQIATARAAAHTQVAGLPGVSLAQVKAALDGLVDRLYDGLGETNTNLYQAIDKLASCMFARIGTP